MAGTTVGAVPGKLRGRIGVGAGAAAAVLTLGACGVLGGDGGEEGSAGSLEEVELQAGEGGMMPPVPSPGSGDPTEVDLDGVSLEAPENWETTGEGNNMCLTPPGQPDCGYGSIRLFVDAAGQHPQNWPLEGEAFSDDNGWADSGDATNHCRSLDTAASGDVGVEGAELTNPEGFFEHADGRTSHHAVWSVDCENDDTFEVRMWFLPETDVLLYVWSADPQHDQVYEEAAASMDTTDHRG